MILAVILGHVGPGQVLSVLGESAVLAHASTSHTEQHVEVLLEIAISKNTAVESLQNALLMSTIKMGNLVMETRPTASRESVRHTMISASTTSPAVSGDREMFILSYVVHKQSITLIKHDHNTLCHPLCLSITLCTFNSS